jgi:hypothetical protein
VVAVKLLQNKQHPLEDQEVAEFKDQLEPETLEVTHQLKVMAADLARVLLLLMAAEVADLQLHLHQKLAVQALLLILQGHPLQKLVAEAEPQAAVVAELELEAEMVEAHPEIQDQAAEAETMVSQLADLVDLELHI